MVLLSITGHCNEPLGVTKGVSIYGSESWDSKYKAGGWDAAKSLC